MFPEGRETNKFMAFPPRQPRGSFNPRFRREQQQEHRTNQMIRVPQVRLVGDNITVGVYPIQDALRMAQEQGLDLVEISPQADPPVCKIIDYNKFLYEKKRKEKEMKAKHAEAFLKEGNKVKAYVQFKGRAIMFKERGELLLLKFAERLAEVGQPEALPKMEGKRMLIIFAPKTQKKKPVTQEK